MPPMCVVNCLQIADGGAVIVVQPGGCHDWHELVRDPLGELLTMEFFGFFCEGRRHVVMQGCWPLPAATALPEADLCCS
jgi:hypothetical protein